MIRGINIVLGEETFQAGLRNYIDKNKFSSVNEDNFWSALTVEAHKSGILDQKLTVKTIMKDWINQPGYPVLNVTVNRNTGNVQLTQVYTIKINSKISVYNIYFGNILYYITIILNFTAKVLGKTTI